EKFESLFVGRRNDRVGPLEAFAFVLDAEGGVLPCEVLERAAWINADKPQIVRQIASLENGGLEMFIHRQLHVGGSPENVAAIGPQKAAAGTKFFRLGLGAESFDAAKSGETKRCGL